MFYEVTNDEGRRKRYTSAYTLGETNSIIGICPECGRQIKRTINLCSESPMALIKENYSDFIPYYVSFKIVSVRFKEIAEQEGLVGLKFRKAELISAGNLSESDKRELKTDGIPLKNVVQNPPEYYKLDLEYGAVYHEKSKIIVKSICDKCGIKIYATEGQKWIGSREEYPVILNANSLKGFDMFFAEGYGTSNFCTERFYGVYKQYNLTGLLFTPIEVL